ncbi:hypothetical protein FRC01_005623 [Tulasnella sp. 417]|nr:hypothetical protein FRC01_005623 [Tulasnella sp. 417]
MTSLTVALSQLDLQLAIAAQYEEDLSAKERYLELLSTKLKQVEKTAQRRRREVEKDRVLLANVQDVLEHECEGLEEELRAERATAISSGAQSYEVTSQSNDNSLRRSSSVDREVYLRQIQQLEEVCLRQTQQLEAVIRGRDQLLLDLEAEKEKSQCLAASLSAADSQLTITAAAFVTAKETIKELQAERDQLRASEAAEDIRQELEVELAALREEAAGLRSTHKLELDRVASAHRDAENDFAARESSYHTQLDNLQEQLNESEAKRLAAEDRIKFLTSEVEGLKRNIETLEYEKMNAERQSFDSSEAQNHIEALEKESERARRRIRDLERGSGNKELEITKLRKKLENTEDDLDGMNEALLLKQQELEVLKRKFGVRGTTAVPAKTQPAPAAEAKATGILKEGSKNVKTAQQPKQSTPPKMQPAPVNEANASGAPKGETKASPPNPPQQNSNTEFSPATTTGAGTPTDTVASQAATQNTPTKPGPQQNEALIAPDKNY